MISGLRPRYYIYEDGLEKTIAEYKEHLPEGMEASNDYIEMLRGTPHGSTAKASGLAKNSV